MATSATAGESQAPAQAPVPVPVAHFNRLDESDLAEARALGLLRSDMAVCSDAASSDYGIAYEKKGGTKAAGCGADVFVSQKSLQERCKHFAMQRGFQLIVAGSSTRPNGGGNVKYKCKKLHGQQFFDPNTPASELSCPFYVNGYGKGTEWKITRACFLHNHYKFIGWRPAAGVAANPNVHGSLGMNDSASMFMQNTGLDGNDMSMLSAGMKMNLGPPPSLSPRIVLTAGQTPNGNATAVIQPDSMMSASPRPPTQRNTTLSTKALCRMVTDEISKFPSPALVMAKLDGKMIKRILLSQGHTINHMMASRVKRQLLETRVNKIRMSFQKLAPYLRMIAEKNPGSLYQVETTEQGVFKRALFIPNATMHAVKYCRKIVALDRITPSWQDAAIAEHNALGKLEDNENDDAISGVYLKAITKDYNDQVLTFALALVVEENQANWEWFLSALQTAHAVAWGEYTVVAGRTRGLQAALQNVWPHASHHFCMRRIVEEELILHKKIPLSPEKKQRIYDLARSESEAEYTALRADLVRTSEAAIQFLDGLNRANWVKYAFLEVFRRPTFNELTCDLSMALGNEDLFSQNANISHTSWFSDKLVRSSQPLLAFNQYFMKIAENFHRRRQSVEHRSPQELVPMRYAQLEQILQGSQRCEVR